ncbi:MAG TPA: ATP phosphoribosyltransferase regulatory subunit, partial [Patescibacteria group bacterium]|nr:ATP phosphoribosyltransferase regulatory subunit [Patescibacteria group bacterium]
MANRQTKKESGDPFQPTKKQKSRRIPRLRGMKDVLFEEYKYWELVLQKANDLARSFGFQRVDTPVLEKADLYQKSTGTETDVVSKEMYEFTDKNGDKVALRPEATPGLTRAYVEHGMFNLPQPVKMFWV